MKKAEFLFYKSIEDNDFKQFCDTIDDVNINGENNYSKIPLIMCSELGRTDMIKELINRNVDVNRVDFMKSNALMWLSKSGSMEILKTLLNAGIDVNRIERDFGTTPIMWWVVENCTSKEHIFELFKHGADLTATDVNGESVLDYAKSSPNPEIYPYLENLLKIQNSYTNKLNQAIKEYRNFIDVSNNNNLTEAKNRREELYKKIKYYLEKGARIERTNIKTISHFGARFKDEDIKKQCKIFKHHLYEKSSALDFQKIKETMQSKAKQMTPYEILHSNDLGKDI